jgi:hypothetical protein
MSALTFMMAPIRCGWAIRLSDGREVARFYGPGARWRATRRLARAMGATG